MKISVGKCIFTLFMAFVSAETFSAEIEFECGHRCQSVKKVEFIVYADGRSKSQEEFIKSHILKYQDIFNREVEKLPNYKKIIFEARMVTVGAPSYFRQKSEILRAYVVLQQNLYSKTTANIHAFSYFNESIYFRSDVCEDKQDHSCISSFMDQSFNEQIVYSLRDPLPTAIH